MRELELDGIHDDGEHIVLRDLDGEKYTLHIDEALRAAVRRDRPALNLIQAASSAPLRPKEIQAMLRAGRSAEEIASIADIEIEHVRRYEGPVLAERGFAAERARTFRVGKADGPTLDALVAERLAARQAGDVTRWDAWRGHDGLWTLELAFTAAGRDRAAHWIVDMTRRSVKADDDEARWLTLDDEADEPTLGRARLTALRSTVYDQSAFDESSPAAYPHAQDDSSDPAHSSAIDEDELAALNARRGVRGSSLPEEGDATWSTLQEDAQQAQEASPARSRWPFRRGADRAADAEAREEHLRAAETPAAEEAHRGEDAEPDQDASGPLSLVPQPGSAEEAPLADPIHASDTIDLTPLPGFDDLPEQAPAESAKQKPRPKRSSIPSWDEIVFGSKHD